MTEYRGRPVGYTPWPGRAALWLLTAFRWLWQWAAITLIALAILTTAGVALGLVLLAGLLPYLLAAGPVTP